MRTIVLGAGAVGGTIGGRLLNAGHEVVLLARGEHATVMREQGLRLATPDAVMNLRPEVVERPEDLQLRTNDVLVLAAKSQDTIAILDAVAGLPVGGPRGPSAALTLPVACAQNAVINERLALRRFQTVLGVCVMLPAVFLEPGKIDAQGTPVSGILELGRYPHGTDGTTETLAGILCDSGFVANPREQVMPWKYAKLLRNLANSLQALCGLDLDDAGQEIVRDLSKEAKSEGERCLAAAGIDVVSDDVWDANRDGILSFAAVEGRFRGGGSSWQSVERGAGSIEADALNGEIAMLGRMTGMPTPVNQVLQLQANALISRGDRPGSVTPADLVAALGR